MVRVAGLEEGGREGGTVAEGDVELDVPGVVGDAEGDGALVCVGEEASVSCSCISSQRAYPEEIRCGSSRRHCCRREPCCPARHPTCGRRARGRRRGP